MQASVPTPTTTAWFEDVSTLPPPDPAQRLPLSIDELGARRLAIGDRDARRLELHAALTAAGIAPVAGDREAIELLAALPAGVHAAVRRWIGRAI